jgi:hypothetical protein
MGLVPPGSGQVIRVTVVRDGQAIDIAVDLGQSFQEVDLTAESASRTSPLTSGPRVVRRAQVENYFQFSYLPLSSRVRRAAGRNPR